MGQRNLTLAGGGLVAAGDREGARQVRAFLHVAGIPVSKGSRIPGRRRDGSLFSRPAGKSEKAWAEQIAYCARANRPGGKGLTPPYEIELEFSMPEPKRPSWGWPSTCDVDKMSRLALDALVVGGLLLDDRHVVSLVASKRFAGPGASGVAVTVR